MTHNQQDSTPECPEQPSGELLLRTLAMPADTNTNGDIFGGWIMSQMDIAGGILAQEITAGAVVTVAVDSMKFIRPVQMGDVVCCYGEMKRLGNTSLALHLEVWVRPRLSRGQGSSHLSKVTEALFTYVAIDENGAKRPIPRD
ncbi:acyl-CoA thioester hydrolase YciA [Marinobacterium rhizophilum]|uniref:Acyl-CoA thioester hydrolase YciA n=1 Tax=Marinobacterium rhizophilum TaxID=420402 RepID=A0ABY5HN34_9GAMM|nr:acyl-CoA thioester hydrolase YciA [Marinobacterium rhizophilum]UTW12620.1 acyl-CoA thioester hydrolase YciA [Marinobacterium rhizophilum]